MNKKLKLEIVIRKFTKRTLKNCFVDGKWGKICEKKLAGWQKGNKIRINNWFSDSRLIEIAVHEFVHWIIKIVGKKVRKNTKLTPNTIRITDANEEDIATKISKYVLKVVKEYKIK